MGQNFLNSRIGISSDIERAKLLPVNIILVVTSYDFPAQAKAVSTLVVRLYPFPSTLLWVYRN